MTLNITIAASWGMWQSSDHRQIDQRTRKLRTESTHKHVGVVCTDGALLIAYTGLVRFNDRQLSDWLRGFIRGEQRSIDETLILVREKATADLAKWCAKHREPHSFVIGAFLQGRPWLIELSDIKPGTMPRQAQVLDEFQTSGQDLAGLQRVWLTGVGASAVSEKDVALLQMVSGKRPRRSIDYLRLLNDVNRRAASARHPDAKTISPECETSYMPPEGIPMKSRSWDPLGKLEEIGPTPLLWQGIDSTDFMKLMHRQLAAVKEDRPFSEAEMDRMMNEIGKRSVTPDE